MFCAVCLNRFLPSAEHSEWTMHARLEDLPEVLECLLLRLRGSEREQLLGTLTVSPNFTMAL